jgi:Icc-related predicted phosphoesterase
MRIAAVGDVHVGLDLRGRLRESLALVREQADVLLLAGDLTRHGTPDEGRVMAEEIADLGIPVIAVLGNHDYHHDAQDAIREDLERVGATVLEGESVTLSLPGGRLGIAGVKGFGGGFGRASGAEYGEIEMKAFIRHTKAKARQLQQCLEGLQCDVRVALTHYAPIKGTLLGEKLEIYPFLGSHWLGDAIDEGRCNLAIHGHAHHGSEQGVTAGGVPVRNVARPLIRQAYRIFTVRGGEALAETSPASA